MITIGLVDDEPLFTAGLALILNGQTGMDVLWQAQDGREAIDRQRNTPVDVILLDIQIPIFDGIQTTKKLLEVNSAVKIAILTTFDSDNNVVKAIDNGASGFLMKNTPPDELVEAVRVIHRGESVISPGPTAKLFDRIRQMDNDRFDPAHAGTDQMQVRNRLTLRETEVLKLVAHGHSNREICEVLSLSMPTVKKHIGNLFSKTQARDRVHLVLLAFRAGITAPI